MNLGYYRFGQPVALFNLAANRELDQRRFVLNAVELLGNEGHHRILGHSLWRCCPTPAQDAHRCENVSPPNHNLCDKE